MVVERMRNRWRIPTLFLFFCPCLLQAQGDWLVDAVDAQAEITKTDEGYLVLSNGLVSRTFTLYPNVATVALEETRGGNSFLRSVRPEAVLTIDGHEIEVGGLTGQPVHNYLLKEWIPDMKAVPGTFKMTDYRIEETRERFPWKKRPEWMPRDMPWPVPGKELVFTYRLDDEAIDTLVAANLRDGRRKILFEDDFVRLRPGWRLAESGAHERNSFVNEGKVGEIMALSHTAVYAERDFADGAKTVSVRIVPGTDRSASWGPGLALCFENRTVKMNVRTSEGKIGFFDGEKEHSAWETGDAPAVWLRMELQDRRLEASASLDGKTWRPVGSCALTKGEVPLTVRIGKMDARGGSTDAEDGGTTGRSRVEAFSMSGGLPSHGSPDDLRAALAYLKDLTVGVHYELYDCMPVFCKWITVENRSGREIVIDRFTSEILAVAEPESTVDSRKNWLLPNITLETDYNFGGMSEENLFASSLEWKADPLYATQVNYERTTPCLLEVAPKKGPKQRIAPGGTFSSYRVWELLNDSWDRERKSLAYRRMMRALAPWVTENPILMHVRSADDESVKRAIDQCAEVGFEMVIMTFGSGFNAEDDSSENLARMKELADYAASKHVALGGYSLLASRHIDGENDVVLPEGVRPRFGNSPCVESRWGQEYFRKLYGLYERTGLSVFEHDGSYPGDWCYSVRHPGHEGAEDSQWNQFRRVSDFYKWCRGKGIYLNVPDLYFLNGSSKTAMGYRETNWSLPREQQEIIERQNIYDGTWSKTPSMGWMFVPLVEYHGGGKAATIEPLREHLPHYGQRLANLFGAGVQACYRGPQLYDAPETKTLVRQWVDFYKRHREVLDGDIVHVRRPDGRDYDAILHVNPFGEEKGLLMVYNPLDEPIRRRIRVNLYYTGLEGKATVSEQDGKSRTLKLDRDRNAVFEVEIPAKSQTWFVMR